MMNNPLKVLAITLMVFLFAPLAAHATLISRLGGQAVYDTELNVSYVSNADLAKTNTFGVAGIDSSGAMYLGTAQAWIKAVNQAGYLGFNDWRLPDLNEPDTTCSSLLGSYFGQHCSGGDLGHLFYTELGGVFGTKLSAHHNSNYDLFTNIQDFLYWSTPLIQIIPPDGGHLTQSACLDFFSGFEYLQCGPSSYYNTWAVRNGDVGAGIVDPNAVPEPSVLALLLIGVLGLGVVSKRQS